MPTRTSPSFRRRRLGRRLKQLREQARMTLDEAAAKLDKTRSSLARVEKGETKADVHLVRSMMDVYDHRDDNLIELARDAAKKAWWRQYSPTGMGYTDVETEASRVLEFAVLNIPGLLQTEAYHRAGLAGASLRRTPEEVDNQVTVRQIRQQRLTDDEHPLELAAIVDEAALHRAVGGAEVMPAQLVRLIETSELARVTLQVLPFDAGKHAGMNGAFIVLEFPEPDEPDLLYLAHVSGSTHVERGDDVRAARLVHERLRSQALPPDESVALIERLALDRYRSP